MKIKKYLKIDNSYKTYYIKNNSAFEEVEPTTENLFYNITNDVDIVLSCLKIPSSKVGYKYWKDAVFIYILNQKNQFSICKEIYPTIGLKYDKSALAVERAMRICLENTLFNISKDQFNIISSFMYNYSIIPHNSEILSRLVELIVSKEFQQEKLNLKFLNNQR